jgi:RecA/RadA recombinase
MASNFSKVVRAKSKLRLALTGVSGSGKTLGALYIAYGLTGDWGKIALIDTEHERARMYANREDLETGEFLYSPLHPPYIAERYMALVKEATNIVGEDGVVIIDSFTHAWNNEGGVLDQKEKIAARSGMNSYTAWNEAGKIQNNLVNTILAVPCHTIVTMRSKMDYVLQENERGKMQPVKVGLAPMQRDDTEYEFDIVLNIERNHVATASKDVTFLDKYGEVITKGLGEQLKMWLDDGVDPAVIMGERQITKEQWIEISKDYKENPDAIQAAYNKFGYDNPSDIRQKDIDGIIEVATEYVKAEGVPYA